MFLKNLFKKKELKEDQEEKTERWNRFIDEVCYRDIDEENPNFNKIQRNAVLCFWYDTEMQSGGHSGYFDCYPNTNSKELYNALTEVSTKEIADNYKKALKDGQKDEYQETDNKYYSFNPSLFDYLREYVENNLEDIFK